MREIMPYIWIGIIIFAASAELHTRKRVFIWLVPAGLAGFIISLLGAEVWMQVLLFFILTPVLLILSRTFFNKYGKVKDSGLFVGSMAIVTEEINNYKNTGEIRINGLAFNAQSEEDDVIYETGLVITVISVDGGKAICSR